MDELKEISIFLTHYVGFPLGLEAGRRNQARGRKSGRRPRRKARRGTRRTTSTTPFRCTRAGTSMTSRYAALSRDELATLVPELLLIGQLIDRSGMAWCISAFGREEMVQIAIEEWMGASPIYTKRMQQALDFEGDRRHHDLQGPAARHRRPAAVHGLPLHRARPLARRVPARPLRRADGRRADGRGLRPRHVPRHRGPDVRRHRDGHQPQGAGPADPPAAARCPPTGSRTARGRSSSTSPTRRWPTIPALDVVAPNPRRHTELDPIDPTDEGMSDYSGALLSDLDFGAFSHSALVRIADEVCLQMHLLNLSFTLAVRQARRRRNARAGQVDPHQAADRHRRHGGRAHPPGARAARWRRRVPLRVLELHPLLNPAAYVSAEFGPDVMRRAPLARIRGRGVDLAVTPERSVRCRRSSQPSIRTSTWKSPARDRLDRASV